MLAISLCILTVAAGAGAWMYFQPPVPSRTGDTRGKVALKAQQKRQQIANGTDVTTGDLRSGGTKRNPKTEFGRR